jgi:monovalent cation:H+ antiporter-2, CPA2 family
VVAVVPVAGSVTLGALVLVLSSTILPPLDVLLVLLAVVGFVLWLMWRSFIKVYASAQIAIADTLAAKPEPDADGARQGEPKMLEEADVATLVVNQGSVAAGKLIRELELRTRTGASIVCFERGGRRAINPGPDEELRAWDKLLLLGNTGQLEAACDYLRGKTDAPNR